MTTTMTTIADHAASSPAETAAPSRREIDVTRRIKNGQCVRQGGVLVRRIRSLPAGAVARHRRDLAVGVRASHIAADPATTYQVGGDDDIYVASPSPWLLDHDEHHAFLMPAGFFRSWRQVEFPAMIPRPVRD